MAKSSSVRLVLNPQVDLYLAQGCGRCSLHNTPQCKVHHWQPELQTLRQIALESGLKEEIKWGVPVYTLDNKNLISVSAFKANAVLSFFKGVLLKDEHQVLQTPGERSQSVRLFRFTEVAEIDRLKNIIRDYINEAIQLEKKGAEVVFQKNQEPIPEELEQQFTAYPVFKKAFFELTPGKQRGYLIYFSQSKQSATRTSRIKNKMEDILKGIGMHDHYKGKK
ncbi:MAG: YdeI/OmpD-associated family protein [Chitinophagaceae bacterium]|jgi:uncharacterized protein YdeI (YjbR/CyaY-like superfamily)